MFLSPTFFLNFKGVRGVGGGGWVYSKLPPNEVDQCIFFMEGFYGGEWGRCDFGVVACDRVSYGSGVLLDMQCKFICQMMSMFGIYIMYIIRSKRKVYFWIYECGWQGCVYGVPPPPYTHITHITHITHPGSPTGGVMSLEVWSYSLFRLNA